MPGMYPDDQIVEIFGEQVMYPGLDPVTHKFTDGDFFDPLKKPSHIPAATFNLILDNLENLISAMGLNPTNTDPDQLRKALLRGFSPRVIGEYHDLSFEPSIDQLISWRWLPLKYQIIKIAQYEELCALKYVGNAKNATERWWYKCNENGTRNIDGQFMRVEDRRGLFPRGAGANEAVRTNINDPLSPPYDGKSIGEYQQDQMQPIYGEFYNNVFSSNGSTNVWGDGRLFKQILTDMLNSVSITPNYTAKNYNKIIFSTAEVVRTGADTKPASISVNYYIVY